MRAPRLSLAAAALCGLAACASSPETTPIREPSSAPTPVANHDWFFSADDATARLAYGLEASDDLRIGLDCQRASGRLDLSAMAAADSPAEILVESGGDTERYAATSEPSQLHEGQFLTATASTTDPVFLRFRRLGWLALWRDGTRETYAPHARSRPDIEQFFAFCG